MPEDFEDDLLSERSLPHNLEAERCVLGSLLLAPDRFDQIEGRLAPDDFFNTAYGNVFEAILSMSARSMTIDIVVLKDELQKLGFLEAAGGALGLSSLMDTVPSGANVEYYAQLVREKSILRRLIQAGTNIIHEAGSSKEVVQTVVDNAEQEIFRVAERGTTGEAGTLKDALHKALERIEKQSGGQHGVTGLATGFPELDDMTAGFHEDELIIIAARPSMGKSTLALNLMRHMAMDYGNGAVLFSLEMSAMNIAQNMLCAHGKLDAQRLRTGKLSSEDWTHVGQAVDTLSHSPIFIDDTPSISLAELRGKTRRLKAKYDIKICFIDYLQLMTASSTASNRSREQEVSEISRGLKALAKELSIPVVALSQLSRKSTGREDNRPVMSDLRESGAIEQDADVIMLIHRPDYYAKKGDEPQGEMGETEILLVKQRNGPTGEFSLLFMGNQLRFVTPDTSHRHSHEATTEEM